MVSGVNRTSAFFQEVARNSPRAPAASSAPAPQAQPSQLEKEAHRVNVELSKCRSKLAELSALARKRSIYVDHTAEIERLTGDVKEGITLASSSIEAFEARFARMHHKNDHMRRHYENLLGTLRKQLCDVTKSLKDALYQRAQIMIQQESRRKMYSHNDMDHSATSAQGRRRFTMQPTADAMQQMDLESGDVERPSRSVIADAKAEALANVQRAIGELTQIFQRVTTLVSQQDEMIQRIDADTEQSLDNVMSDNRGRSGRDLGPQLRALLGDGAGDGRALHLPLGVYDDAGVVLEVDEVAVVAPPGLALAYDNGGVHLLPEVRLALLDGRQDHVAHGRGRQPVEARADTLEGHELFTLHAVHVSGSESDCSAE
ncbi:syntaxin 5 [Babesia caballi]|uniref:Syntaxin 5 n=1 Tax=Babesia caballi TaxID=5871 RepID=A0AAV4LMM6_BABCB|nr:syntaxin 5 [Babesia caballi]